jgi:hypothetical protein
MYVADDTVPHKVPLNVTPVLVYSCKKCGKPNCLTPRAFWNISDFGAKCEKCETKNTMTLEKGELKKQEWVHY